MSEVSVSDRIISSKERRELIPYCDVHILRMEKAGKFPRRIRLGPNRVGWSYLEIQDWIATRKDERDMSPRTENSEADK